MSKRKIIISLFDYTGNWSKPYKENGFEVVQVDIQHGIDILTWDYTFIPSDSVLGVLASCPCTDFAVSGARWFKQKDLDGRTFQSVKLVSKTKEIIDYFKPEFWVIENPVSRIHKLNTWMGSPVFIFHPYEFSGYGFENDRYTKKTCLWGVFNVPVKKPLSPLDFSRIHCPKYSNGKNIPWGSIECKNYRSVTPLGFSYAFYESNH